MLVNMQLTRPDLAGGAYRTAYVNKVTSHPFKTDRHQKFCSIDIAHARPSEKDVLHAANAISAQSPISAKRNMGHLEGGSVEVSYM